MVKDLEIVDRNDLSNQVEAFINGFKKEEIIHFVMKCTCSLDFELLNLLKI